MKRNGGRKAVKRWFFESGMGFGFRYFTGTAQILPHHSEGHSALRRFILPNCWRKPTTISFGAPLVRVVGISLRARSRSRQPNPLNRSVEDLPRPQNPEYTCLSWLQNCNFNGNQPRLQSCWRKRRMAQQRFDFGTPPPSAWTGWGDVKTPDNFVWAYWASLEV